MSFFRSKSVATFFPVDSINPIIPQKQTKGSAAYDLYCYESKFLERGETAAIRTGLGVSIPPHLYGKIESRSSLALNYTVFVLGGIIDSDYRGEIKVILTNQGKDGYYVEKGNRIAQLIFLQHDNIQSTSYEPHFSDFSSERGSGGFGSTGK